MHTAPHWKMPFSAAMMDGGKSPTNMPAIPTVSHILHSQDQDPCDISACVANGDEVELYAVWVAPAYRRIGVGRALIDYGRA